MKAASFLSAVLLTTLTTTASVAAAGRSSAAPPQLFERNRIAVENSATHPQGVRALVTDAVEEFIITVEPATVAANPEILTIDLPGLPTLEAVRTRFVNYRKDGKSWSGTLRHVGASGKGPGYIHLGYHGDQITGLMEFEGQRFRIAGSRGNHRLFRLSDDLSTRSCAMELPAEALAPALDTSSSSVEGLSQAREPLSLQTEALGTIRIDVLAVYPREFFTDANAAAEAALPTFIQDSIWLANDAFTNSGVDAYYNLVGVVPITGTSQPTNGLFNSLGWMDPRTSTAPTTAPPQELADLRNAFGADVVNLFIPFNWSTNDYCGVANQPLANNPSTGAARFYRGNIIVSNTTMGDRAFSVQRTSCGQQDYTLGHEIGHNYGMGHDDASPTDPLWLYPYGRGKVLTFSDGSKKATVMACECTGCFCTRTCSLGSGAVCNRIPYFSDPTRNYPGTTVSLGNSSTTDPRDNARVGRDNVATYAAFRAQSTNTPPTANFTVSCMGRTCTFNASGSTDNAAIPSTGYWWDFGEPSSGTNNSGTGQSVTHTYGNGTTFRAHLVVKDAGGQTDVVWGTANPQPVYEGYVEQANCRAISGWAWDQYQPNTPINVNIRRDGTSVSTVSANGFRQDLQNAGKGNGAHAFGYTPNSGWKDGNWHTPDVRFGTTTTSLTFLMSPNTIICNASIFTNTAAPTENGSTGGQVYTVSTRFSSNRAGYITQLGFYRATGETGSNTLRLWTNAGLELANVTTNCSSAGWCWGTLSTPVAISANTDYRVGVNTNTYQSKTGCGLNSAIYRDPLTAHQGYWMAGHGFPTSSGACNSNFHVDVKFDI